MSKQPIYRSGARRLTAEASLQAHFCLLFQALACKRQRTIRLFEGVSPRSPPGEEQRLANCLEQLLRDRDTNCVERSSLGEDLGEILEAAVSVSASSNSEGLRRSRMRGKTHNRSRGCHEDQTAQIGSALVTQSTGSVDESADTIGLQGRADERGAPSDSSGRGLLGMDEFLLGVGGLGTLVGLTKERRENWVRTSDW